LCPSRFGQLDAALYFFMYFHNVKVVVLGWPIIFGISFETLENNNKQFLFCLLQTSSYIRWKIGLLEKSKKGIMQPLPN
jgi:hypothetical protein